MNHCVPFKSLHFFHQNKMPSFAAEMKQDDSGLVVGRDQDLSYDIRENNILLAGENQDSQSEHSEPVLSNHEIFSPQTSNKHEQLRRGHDELKKYRKWYSWIFPVVATVLIVWVVFGYLFHFALPIVLSSSFSVGQRILHAFYFVCFAFISVCILYPFYKCTFTHPGMVFKDDRTWALTPEQIRRYKQRGPNVIAELEREIQQIMNMRDNIRDLSDELNGRQVENERQDHVDDVDNDFAGNQTELSSMGRVRICDKCWVRKPDRAHHSRQLNCCVLRMDHFCPWFNNCIGYYNHKYFFAFLLWVSIGGFFVSVTMSQTLFKTLISTQRQNGTYPPVTLGDFNLIWIYIISFCFGFAMMFFAGYHFKLIISNRTTLESMDKERRLYEQYHCYPYDIGLLENIKSILGNNIWLWLSPFHPNYVGDGCHYPTRKYQPVDNEDVSD